MKKLIYVFAVMFAMTSLTSCEKEPNEPDDNFVPIITLAELDGRWNFIKVDYDGKTYEKDNDFKDELECGLKKLNFIFDTKDVSHPKFKMENVLRIVPSTGTYHLSPANYFEYINNQMIIEDIYNIINVSYNKESKILELHFKTGINNYLECYDTIYSLKK